MTLLWVFAIVAIMAVVSTLLTRGMVVLVGRLGGETIRQLHESAEHIVEHHTVPPAWQAKLMRRYDALKPDAASGRAATHRARAKLLCLRQLGRMIKHFQRTSIVADEEARAILVSELAKVDGEWRARSWDEMCTSGP